MISVTNHISENIHRLVQHFSTTTWYVEVYTVSTFVQLICSDMIQYVCVHVREAKVAGEMWFNLIPLVLMNVSEVCSDSCPIRVQAPGPPTHSLEPRAWGI